MQNQKTRREIRISKSEIRNNIEALGGTSISYDNLTSTITFQADFNSSERIAEFCRKLRENASLVTMRILLVDVSLNSTTSAGIDWTKFIMGYGTQNLTASPNGFGNRPPAGTSTSGPMTAANACPEAIPNTPTATAIASSKLLPEA